MPRDVTWVLVADGARAQIFAQKGPSRELEPVATRSSRASQTPSREIVSDRPGRTFDSAAPGRHAKEPPSDPHRLAKQRFVEELAALLEQGRLERAFDRLILVAPPQALGDLRSSLSTACLRLVCAEIGKDLTQTPLARLTAQLGDSLKAQPPA